ncbi:hypothetical protein CLV47_10131 [Antricoccus suffuscus]|uniref:Uncharacterized protein n=1 Tax=Antricoccus suffuscus TaxID=1629062 RepID=A0A2T1A607_9ACTN|nr:hypothetical protein [Antricoccus suffuscus]PRZ43907.1 hypothetical protein CLV47_10131 [Antricoccus suffuscus]
MDVEGATPRLTDRDLADRYARLYGPFAVVMLLLTFFPYMRSGEPKGGITPHEFGSLWREAFGPGGDNEVATFGAALFVAAIVLVLIATFVPPPPVLTATIAVLALIIVVMVWTRPGFYNTPALTDAGIADIAIGYALVVLTITHTIHTVLRRSARGDRD